MVRTLINPHYFVVTVPRFILILWFQCYIVNKMNVRARWWLANVYLFTTVTWGAILICCIGFSFTKQLRVFQMGGPLVLIFFLCVGLDTLFCIMLCEFGNEGEIMKIEEEEAPEIVDMVGLPGQMIPDVEHEGKRI